MDLVVLSYKRSTARQSTWYALARAGFNPILVVREEEYMEYGAFKDALHTIPTDTVSNVAETRDYIVQHVGSSDHLCMFDDDLVFATRRKDDPTKFVFATAQAVREMILALDKALDDVNHVGLASREGGNRNAAPIIENTRMMRVLGYKRSYLLKNNLTFTPFNFMCDFHMTLQLLMRGCAGRLINTHVNNQGASNAPGGCSTQRTPELQAAEAHALAAAYPGLIKAVQKTTKTAWGGATRTDVIVQWKRAYTAGLRSEE